MANIDGFKTKIEAMKQALQAKEPEIATTVSLTIKALANRNIVERGFGEGYSPNRVPAFYLQGKEINQAGAAAIKKAKQSVKKGGNGGYISWRELRQAEGLQTNHVDLTHSGRMWSSIQPLPPMKEGTATVAPLGATDRESQKEMNYNRDRYGNFIERALTAEDRQLVAQVVNDEVQGVLNQFKS